MVELARLRSPHDTAHLFNCTESPTCKVVYHLSDVRIISAHKLRMDKEVSAPGITSLIVNLLIVSAISCANIQADFKIIEIKYILHGYCILRRADAINLEADRIAIVSFF